MGNKHINMSFETLSVNSKTKERLNKLGQFKDSYDKIINRLIDFYLDHKK